MRTKTFLKTMLATTAIALALGGAFYGFGAIEPSSPAVAAVPQAVPVDVVVVEPQAVRLWAEFSARLQAVDRVDLRPQVSGAIVDIRFKEGQRVAKGDVLFVIDPRPYQAAAAQAQADLAAARERHDFAGKELERARSLIKTSAIPQRVLDERANAFTVSKSDIEAAAARLERARIDLDHAFVKAPIAGRVSRAEITLGNLVQAGPTSPVLTSIVADSQIYADFEVDERTYLKFVHGNAKSVEAERAIPVRLQVGGGDAIEIEGRIHSFDNRLDPTTGTIRARALFDNDGGALLPGMFARVKLGSAVEQQGVLLSDKSILTDQDRKFVYVVDDSGKAAYRQVSLGASLEGKRVVLSGLAAGDKVISSNLMTIRPTVPVAPKAAPEVALSK